VHALVLIGPTFEPRARRPDHLFARHLLTSAFEPPGQLRYTLPDYLRGGASASTSARPWPTAPRTPSRRWRYRSTSPAAATTTTAPPVGCRPSPTQLCGGEPGPCPAPTPSPTTTPGRPRSSSARPARAHPPPDRTLTRRCDRSNHRDASRRARRTGRCSRNLAGRTRRSRRVMRVRLTS
jgi:hypothetical protein